MKSVNKSLLNRTDVFQLLHRADTLIMLGSGFGAVVRAVASNTRGRQFKSSHRQKFIYIEHLFTVNSVLKRQKKKKDGWEWPIFNCS